MIKRLLAIAVVASAGLLAAPKAEAGHGHHQSYTYRSGHASCGCPIYTKRYVRSYDRYRRPVYGYSRVAFSHRGGCGHHASYHRHPQHRHPVHHGRYHRGTYGHGSHVTISRGGISLHIGGHSRGRSCR